MKGRGVTEAESDEMLVQAAKQNPAAFAALYEKYLPYVYNYIFYRVGSVFDAEDLTSRTFYQALLHFGRYNHQGLPFSAWLLRIAHNLVANWFRDRSRRPTLSLEEVIYAEARERSLGETSEHKDEAERLRRAIQRLPPERQQLLVLKFVEELSNAEIAAIMGRTEGAIKALLHRTLLSLRRDLNCDEA